MASGDGKPAANVPVALHEQGLVERLWSRPNGNEQTLHQLFNPVERTDNDGVARFNDLFPCHYELRASGDANDLTDFLAPGKDVARAVVPSVAIAAGEELSMTVTLQDEPDYVKLQALRPDGTPPGPALRTKNVYPTQLVNSRRWRAATCCTRAPCGDGSG